MQYQFFSGMDYCEPRLPCDASQIGRVRRLLGEDGIEQLLKATIDCAVDIKAVKPADLERVIVASTVQSKAIAHPVDSRLLENLLQDTGSVPRQVIVDLSYRGADADADNPGVQTWNTASPRNSTATMCATSVSGPTSRSSWEPWA